MAKMPHVHMCTEVGMWIRYVAFCVCGHGHRRRVCLVGPESARDREGGRERDGGDRADQVGLGAGCGAEEGADRRRQEG
jgi:hypothetical protein